MLWFSRPFSLIFLSAAVLLTAACDYRPLHGYSGADKSQSMQVELQKVWIPIIKDREGQLLRNQLLALFQPQVAGQRPKYQLTLRYSESAIGTSVATNDYATRANLNIIATFTLSGAATLTGTSQSVVSYNILDVATATEFTRRNARERAIKQIALDIHRRIAVHLLNEAQTQPR